MSYILGLDPSLAKAGFVVLDTEASENATVDRGLLKTSTADGILVERLIKQRGQIRSKIEEYKIRFVGMEAPFYGSYNTEMLFALNQFLHEAFLDLGLFVVAFPPQQLKKLVFQDKACTEIHKPEMIDKAKTALNLQGKTLAEDVADAYWAGVFGKKFYKRYVEQETTDESLSEYEKTVFAGQHTFTRGMKKGVTEYSGIIYRENDLFYNFGKIKRGKLNGSGNENS